MFVEIAKLRQSSLIMIVMFMGLGFAHTEDTLPLYICQTAIVSTKDDKDFEYAEKVFLRNSSLYHSPIMAEALIDELLFNGVDISEDNLTLTLKHLGALSTKESIEHMARNISVRFFIRMRDIYKISEIKELQRQANLLGLNPDDFELALKKWREEARIDPAGLQIQAMFSYLISTQSEWSLKIISESVRQRPIKLTKWGRRFSKYYRNANWLIKKLDTPLNLNGNFAQRRLKKILTESQSSRLSSVFSSWVQSAQRKVLSPLPLADTVSSKAEVSLSDHLANLPNTLDPLSRFLALRRIVNERRLVNVADIKVLMNELRDEKAVSKKGKETDESKVEDLFKLGDEESVKEAIDIIEKALRNGKSFQFTSYIKFFLLKELDLENVPEEITAPHTERQEILSEIISFIHNKIIMADKSHLLENHDQFIDFLMTKEVQMKLDKMVKFYGWCTNQNERFIQVIDRIFRNLSDVVVKRNKLSLVVRLKIEHPKAKMFGYISESIDKIKDLTHQKLAREALKVKRSSTTNSEVRDIIISQETGLSLSVVSPRFLELYNTKLIKIKRDQALPIQILIFFEALEKLSLKNFDEVNDQELFAEFTEFLDSLIENSKMDALNLNSLQIEQIKNILLEAFKRAQSQSEIILGIEKLKT